MQGGVLSMEPLKINKPIRLIELFAGIGSQAKALQRLGVDFEHYKISEWEVNATASYKAIHKEKDNTDYSEKFTTEALTEILFNIGISTDGKKPMSLQEIARKNEQWKRTVYNNFVVTNNIGSILNVSGADLGVVDTDKYCYLLTYSFPCQDLSLAGKGMGMAKGDNTRSGLLWEVERLLNECNELPQILLMENVTQVHGKKNKDHFDEWIEFLESKGYSNYWKDLNAKNFGIPQNRNRTFMVSVLGDYTYKFPKEFPLELRLKDMLEDSVDEKFYLSDVAIQGRIQSAFRQYNLERSLINEKEIHPTILARYEGAPTLLKEPKIQKVCQLDSSYEQSGRVYSAEGISPTIMSNSHGNTSGGYIAPKVIAGIGEKKSNGGTQWYQQDRIYDDNVAISVTTAFNPYYAVQEKKVTDPFIVASRGRNPENPSDRTAGIPTEQRLEPNFSGCSNTLTTVQKDNYVAEPVIVQKYGDRGTNQYSVRDYAHTIPANPMSDRVQMVVEPKINVVGNYSPSGHDASRIVDTDGLAPTVKENHGTVTALVEPVVCEQRSDEVLRFFKGDYCGALRTIDACGDKRVIEPKIIREQPLERDGWHDHAKEVISPQGVCRTLCAQSNNLVTKIKEPYNLRIRKLTPKECWRLMGFDDADFEKAEKVNSNSQLYKQAGNSIVVDVLYYIFKEMF